MPKFLPVNRHGSTIAIGICDRCKKKVHLSELRPDGNSPGLMVCRSKGCFDVRDPWRGPQRQTEIISLRKPRPDTITTIEQDSSWQNDSLQPVDWVNDSGKYVYWTA